MTSYRYTIRGDAAGGQTWECNGTIVASGATVLDDIMRRTFEELTQGKAVFGKPGVGCIGPYQLDTIFVEREPEEPSP